MQNATPDLEISVDIGDALTPRLRFSVAGQATTVALAPEGATKLAGSLLTACFLCSMGREIPTGTAVAAGQIPVTECSAQSDPDTGLPTFTVSLMGGGELTLVFSPDLAISASTALAQEGVKTAQGSRETLDVEPSSRA